MTRNYVKRRPELFAALLAEGRLPELPSFDTIVRTFLPIHHRKLDLLDDASKERYVNWINTARVSTADTERTSWLIPKLSFVWTRALAMRLTRCTRKGNSIARNKETKILQMSQCIATALQRLCDLADTQYIDFPVDKLLAAVPDLVDSKPFVSLIRKHYWHLVPMLPMLAASKLLETAVCKKDFVMATWIRDVLTPTQFHSILVYHSNNRNTETQLSYTTVGGDSQAVINFLFESADSKGFDFAQYIKQLKPRTKGLAFITSSVFWQEGIKYLYECSVNDGETLLTFLTCGFSEETFAEFVQRLKAYPDFQARKATIDKNMARIVAFFSAKILSYAEGRRLLHWMFPVLMAERDSVYVLLAQFASSVCGASILHHYLDTAHRSNENFAHFVQVLTEGQMTQ